MKRTITILLALMLFSCDTFFHEEDNPYLRIDKQQEKIDLINGIYTRLVRVYNGDYFTLLSRSDDVNYYVNYSFPNSDGGRCVGSGNNINYPSIIGDIYMNLYKAIININNMLLVLSERDDKVLLGELYFLRAYCYFKLARLFGTPPLIEDITVNYYVEKPSYKDVYGFIEKDMLKALELLPETYTDARIPGETPHKGTAKALLAEIYLAMAGYPVLDESKYVEAAKLSAEVIQQADFYCFALQNDFASLWKEENKHDKENVFGLFFSSGSENNWNKIGQIHLSAGPRPYGYYSSERFSANYNLYSIYNPEMKFFDTFPNNYRKYNSLTTGKYWHINYNFPDSTSNSLRFVPFNPILDPCTFISCAVSLKWVGDYLKYTNTNYDLKPATTLYLLRYAQTLLTYAEAKARSGNLDQSAFEAVNKIRRRANHIDLNSPSKYDLPANLSTEQFIDSVVCERAWELSCEPNGRWFDIIRLNLKDKLAGYRYPKDKPTIVPDINLTDDWYFYQIPQEDRWANPNFE
jgi:hypothetical protein